MFLHLFNPLILSLNSLIFRREGGPSLFSEQRKKEVFSTTKTKNHQNGFPRNTSKRTNSRYRGVGELNNKGRE
jgi:hypothetical protein